MEEGNYERFLGMYSLAEDESRLLTDLNLPPADNCSARNSCLRRYV